MAGFGSLALVIFWNHLSPLLFLADVSSGRQLIWFQSNILKKLDTSPRWEQVRLPYYLFIYAMLHPQQTLLYSKHPLHPWSSLLLFLPPGMPFLRILLILQCPVQMQPP